MEGSLLPMQAWFAWARAQTLWADAQAAWKRGQQRQYDRQVQREIVRLRPAMPEANAWTPELTAQIAVARG
jgi:hypothetical protein